MPHNKSMNLLRNHLTPPRTILYFSFVLAVVGFWLAPLSVTAVVRAMVQPASDAHTSALAIDASVRATVSFRPVRPHVDCGKTTCLAITFDDGPNPITTPRILDVLEAKRVPATFFVVGSRVHGQEKLLRRMYYDGNEIGNHSWNHPDLTAVTNSQILAQVSSTQSAVMSAGIPAPTLFRPPYGAVNAAVRSTIPMTLAMWNGDPLDWKEKDVTKVKDSIVASAKPGGVLDLHDIYAITADALGPAIDELKDKYTFVTFSELFDLQPGQRGEYFGR